MKLKILVVSVLLIGFGVLLFNNIESANKWDANYKVEYDELLVLQKHLSPNSPEGIRTVEKIKKMERRKAGHVKAEHPDEFVRILHEMRIPYGKTNHEYSLNYKRKELDKARKSRKHSEDILPWAERGPGNVAGRARGLIVDPDDPAKNTWFVGSVGGGIWKTTDGGATWTDLAPDLPNLAVSTLAMAPSNHDIIFAGTGESMYSVDVINGDGIYKSTDRGLTWNQLSSTMNNPNFNNIARIIVDPQNPDIVLAATSSGRYKINTQNKSGIFKSIDGGNTWTEVYNETEIGGYGRVKKVLHIIDTPGNFNVLYAGIDEKGIIKSTDAGDTWFYSSTGINDFSGRFELAIAPSNPIKVYAAAEGNPNSNLWVSNDSGATWIQTFENGTEPNWLGAQGWYDNTITVHPTFENTVFVGGVRLFQIDVQANNSRNTTQLSTGPVHVDHHNLVIIPGAGGAFRILNANDGGIGISANGASNWDAPINGMVTTQFYGVDKKPGASAYIGGMQDNGTWRSPENSTANSDWYYQIGGDGYETSWHFDDPSKIIGGSQFNGLRRSLDGGLSWEGATSGLNNTGSGSAPFITKIAKSNMEPDLLFAVGSSGVWRSTNFGGSWSLSSITGSNWGGVTSFLDVKISRANPDIVWAGGRMDASGKINVSTDQGVSFNPTPPYGLVSMGGISGLSTHPIDDSTAYVLFSFAHKPKVLRTTDMGQTWEDLSGFGVDTVSSNGFPDVAVYDLLVMPHTPDTIWVASEIGLIESIDNGATWQFADNGFPSVAIWAMTHVDDEVVLATHGRGIWSVEIPGLSTGQTFNPLIKDLFQGPDGFLSINLGLRSLYDSTALFIDGQKYITIAANSVPVDTLIQYIVSQAGLMTVSVTSYKNGLVYNSVSRSINVILLQPAQVAYLNDFNTASNDFVGNGFQISAVSGFPNDAIHSSHPYSNNLNNTFLLTIPIVVASSNADIVYDDVAIIEPGEAGTTYGSTQFWDYVVVEGSLDGINWIPLADGYDARFDPGWLNAYNSSTPGDSTLYRTHTVNLHNTFSAGDQILVRFRLYADGYVTGWGWAIDNLKIQENWIVSVEESGSIVRAFQLKQNYPNPFNPSTTFEFSLPKTEIVTLKIFSLLGQEVATLVSDKLESGNYKYIWDASDFASGVYFYKIQAGEFQYTKKLILMK